LKNLLHILQYAGVQLFYHLPAYIKKSSNELKGLKKLLMDNSFYSVDEFINFKE